MRNEGVYVSGHGHVEAGALSAGRQAVAVNVTQDVEALARLRRQLDDLVEAIRTSSAQLVDAPLLVEAAQQARGEIDRPAPNKFSMLGLLHGIATGVGSVASLATAVEAIKVAVTQLL